MSRAVYDASQALFIMMKDCPNVSGCEMYSLFRLAGTLATWKINYCNADYERCERYKLSSLGRSVPINLMPNGSLLQIRGAAKKGTIE
jgi:hypothetical protein